MVIKTTENYKVQNLNPDLRSEEIVVKSFKTKKLQKCTRIISYLCTYFTFLHYLFFMRTRKRGFYQPETFQLTDQYT